VTPVVRSFVSIPAGVAKMPLLRFTVLTFLGCVPWCFGIAGAGYALGTRASSTTTSATRIHRAALLINAGGHVVGSSPEDDLARRPQIPLVDVKAQYARCWTS
jgi:membrane protein DedA with SNARE-associated domain